MNNITIRKANELDRDEILTLQIKVFAGEQGIPEEDVPLAFDAAPQMFCACDGDSDGDNDGKIIGAITAWMEDYDVHMGRFAIEPEYRGKHIGTDLLRFALKTLFSQGAYKINMEARDEGVKIATSMGAEVTGEPKEFYGAMVTPLIIEKQNFKAE